VELNALPQIKGQRPSILGIFHRSATRVWVCSFTIGVNQKVIDQFPHTARRTGTSIRQEPSSPEKHRNPQGSSGFGRPGFTQRQTDKEKNDADKELQMVLDLFFMCRLLFFRIRTRLVLLKSIPT